MYMLMRYRLLEFGSINSVKPECVLIFIIMGCRILVFYKHILASMNHFDSDMSNSTNMVVYFDEKDVFGQCRTLFMLYVLGLS
jgi:hypothetical protein